MDKQLFLGSVKPTKELMSPVENHLWNKGKGGLWTSTYRKKQSEWVKTGIPTSNNGWLLTVNDEAKILRIDNYSDLAEVYKHYGYDDHSFYPMTHLNFKVIADDYDGMWLTSFGQMATRLSFPHNLYGWDCESTHWFKWVFDEVESIGKVLIK